MDQYVRLTPKYHAFYVQVRVVTGPCRLFLEQGDTPQRRRGDPLPAVGLSPPLGLGQPRLRGEDAPPTRADASKGNKQPGRRQITSGVKNGW